MKIAKVEASEILDSRGNPTVKAYVTLESGAMASASVPSGASTGTKEALELRDEDESRFSGKGVQRACQNVNELIFPKISGMDASDQKKIDEAMLNLDGTENKANLGSNAILAVSLAVARVAAKEKNIPLWQHIREAYGFSGKDNYNFPIPMMNVINGGEHADSGLDFQEFMLVPSGFDNFNDRIRAGAEIYHVLRKNLAKKGCRVAVGDEGGFAPCLETNEAPLEEITQSIEDSSYDLGDQVRIGMDVAASEFYEKEKEIYDMKLGGNKFSSEEMIKMYEGWLNKYQIELIEDPLSEFDWDNWTVFNKKFGEKISVIGDDLLVTNKKLLQEAINKKACNAILIKVNQIGSLSETIETIMLAKENNMKIAVSHRSGETTDDFIGDLAVAMEAEYVKFGAPTRGERVCKYNRIAEIERSEFK